jgi:hypothetical protein
MKSALSVPPTIGALAVVLALPLVMCLGACNNSVAIGNQTVDAHGDIAVGNATGGTSGPGTGGVTGVGGAASGGSTGRGGASGGAGGGSLVDAPAAGGSGGGLGGDASVGSGGTVGSGGAGVGGTGGGGSGGTTTTCALRGESCVTSSCCGTLICSNAMGSSTCLESYPPPADSGTGTGGTGGAGGGAGGGGGSTGTGGSGGSTCPKLPSCNWCSGENVVDGSGCVTGWRCANGADPCTTQPCSASGPCASGYTCGSDMLCWPIGTGGAGGGGGSTGTGGTGGSGGSTGTGGYVGVSCGGPTCSPGENCCVSETPASLTCTSSTSCGDLLVTCDGPEDCGGTGHQCCMPSGAIIQTTCTTGSCLVGLAMCHTAADCPQGQSCCPGMLFGYSYRSCQATPSSTLCL